MRLIRLRTSTDVSRALRRSGGGIEKLKIHFDICMQVKVIATSIYLLGKLTNTTSEVVICLTKLEPFYHFMG